MPSPLLASTTVFTLPRVYLWGDRFFERLRLLSRSSEMVQFLDQCVTRNVPSVRLGAFFPLSHEERQARCLLPEAFRWDVMGNR